MITPLKISIIVPCYNVSSFLYYNFRSLLDQNLRIGLDYEIIYIDDCSADDTFAVLKSFERDGVRIFQNQQNLGVSATRNKGIELANGILLWFVDSDDYIAPNILKSLWVIYEANSSLNGVNISATMVSFDSTIENQKRINDWSFNYNACNFLVSKLYLLNHSISFPVNICSGEDQLFVFQLKFFGGRFQEINEIVYYYRMNPSSLSHVSSHKSHMENMIAMLYFYIEFADCNKCRGSIAARQNLKERIKWSVGNICADAIYLPKEEANTVLVKLKKENLYPYGVLWNRLTLKYGLKIWLLNFLKLPLCFEWYFKVCNKILRNHTI